jgi:hypothetical protein
MRPVKSCVLALADHVIAAGECISTSAKVAAAMAFVAEDTALVHVDVAQRGHRHARPHTRALRGATQVQTLDEA